MTWSLDDVPDSVADWCVDNHTELHITCPYCPTRADMKVCAHCGEEIYPHDGCPDCHDEPALVVDGFGSALVMPPLVTGVAA